MFSAQAGLFLVVCQGDRRVFSGHNTPGRHSGSSIAQLGDSVLPAEILKINSDTPDTRLVSYVA
ncbi:MAG TPA: hypothetical protein VGK21_07210, partial [Candidatus Angelobacter sp.]